MYEEHEDGSFTLHMCEWYEQGRRLVGEYETLADGSGFAVTDEWPAGLKVVVNHPLTRPDGTVMPGVSRLRRFDWKVGPDEGLHADDYEIWERELREQAERDRFDGDLFTAGLDPATGEVVIESTELYRSLVSADTSHEQAWRAYIQVKRAMVTDRQENRFTERYNGKTLESNVVWTKTPDMAPSLSIEKWDEASGWPKGDRDEPEGALQGAKDGDTIVFTITNTSKTDPDTGDGAWFRAKDLKLTDETIVGDGTVVDLVYPDDWDTLILKPGDKVDVKDTLKGFTTENHTDRAQVTGVPLVQCPVVDEDPFDGADDGDDPVVDEPDDDATGRVSIDGRTLCTDTVVESATDDWNATRAKPLASTGTSVAFAALAGLGLLLAGARRRSRRA